MASLKHRKLSGTNNELYSTDEKKECRQRLVKHAVECLTKERETSTCVQRDHVRKAWKKFEQSGQAYCLFKPKEVKLIKEEIDMWELFHDSRTQKKEPKDLRVCYHAGENPINDLNVFLDNGVLSQNIWVIEKNSENIQKVWKVVIESHSTRNVRFFKGDFLACMQHTEGQFDIIYFGSTSPLTSGQDTLKAIGHVFLYNKLASPGALITTFSFPPKDTEDQERINLRELVNGYLKFRLKNTIGYPSDIEKFLGSREDEENYSDYISYQVIDTAYMYIPAVRMLSSSFQDWESFGHEMVGKQHFTDGVKNLHDRPPELSENFLLQLAIHYLSKFQDNPSCKSWVEEVFPDWQNIGDSLIAREISPLQLASSPEFVAFLLYGQIANPSYIVPEKLLRLKYTSSVRQMFSDVFIFDNCQYMFQQFPSVDCEYPKGFQPKYLWVVQTITEGLANKQVFIFKDVFEYCQSATSDEPMEIPQRAEIKFFLLKKEGEKQMSDLRYEDALRTFRECFECNRNENSLKEIERYISFCLKQLSESLVVRQQKQLASSSYKGLKKNAVSF